MNNNKAIKFRYIYGLVMIVIYAGLGVLFLAMDGILNLAQTNRIVIGSAMLLYAGFRLFVTLREMKSENKQDA